MRTAWSVAAVEDRVVAFIEGVVERAAPPGSALWREPDDGEVSLDTCPILPGDYVAEIAEVVGAELDGGGGGEVHGPDDVSGGAVGCAFGNATTGTIGLKLAVLIPNDSFLGAWTERRADGVVRDRPAVGGMVHVAGSQALWFADDESLALSVYVSGGVGDDVLAVAVGAVERVATEAGSGLAGVPCGMLVALSDAVDPPQPSERSTT